MQYLVRLNNGMPIWSRLFTETDFHVLPGIDAEGSLTWKLNRTSRLLRPLYLSLVGVEFCRRIVVQLRME